MNTDCYSTIHAYRYKYTNYIYIYIRERERESIEKNRQTQKPLEGPKGIWSPIWTQASWEICAIPMRNFITWVRVIADKLSANTVCSKSQYFNLTLPNFLRLGSARDPIVGAHDALPDPLVGPGYACMQIPWCHPHIPEPWLVNDPFIYGIVTIFLKLRALTATRFRKRKLIV